MFCLSVCVCVLLRECAPNLRVCMCVRSATTIATAARYVFAISWLCRCCCVVGKNVAMTAIWESVAHVIVFNQEWQMDS